VPHFASLRVAQANTPLLAWHAVAITNVIADLVSGPDFDIGLYIVYNLQRDPPKKERAR